MALQRATPGTGVLSSDLVRILLIVVAVIALMLVLTAIFGVSLPGPSYQITPDPAAGMGLPF